MKSRSSGYSSDSEQQNVQQQDLSVLRKPIHTALTGFLEARRAYENGTEEIRRLLSRECDIIYECNICRNMFRSLTNFISHKRVYCRNSFNNLSHNLNPNRNGYIDHDISTIIQAEENYVNNSTNITKSSNSSNNTKDKDNLNTNKLENSNKDLTSIVERLIKREQENRLLKLTDFYDQVNNKLTQDEIIRKKHILQLDKVPNSTAAVYQTVKQNENEQDTMKNEVNEVHQLLENNENVLGPDGKIITKTNDYESLSDILSSSTTLTLNDNYNKNNSINNDNNSNNNNNVTTNSSNKNNSQDLSCKICHKKFSTEKMLKLHIQAKHITSTYVYQCPSCLEAFLQPGSVIRHLSTVHRKSARRIRLMRESIFKKRVRISDMQTRGPSKELARLRFRMDDKESKNTLLNNSSNATSIGGGSQLRLNDSGEWSSVNSPSCTYCGKRFERKAVLTTHLTNCPIKVKLNSSSSSSSSTRRSNDNYRNSTNSNNIRLNSSNSININCLDDESLKSTKTTDKKSSFIVHSILASIDLTNDDSRSSSTATTSTSANAVISKRKRKKTSKVLKEDCNDIIESEKLNEMFLKLDCSDSNISLTNGTINSDGICNNDVMTITNDNTKKDDSSDDCSLVKTLKAKENDFKDDKKKLSKDAIKIETPDVLEAQMAVKDDSKIIIKRKLSAYSVKEEETNENEVSQLEQQLFGDDIVLPVKSVIKFSDTKLQELDKSRSTSKTQAGQQQQQQSEEQSNGSENHETNEQQIKQDISFICKICKKRFDAVSNVRRHISMFHYRSRKFGCKICHDYKAFRKCDVINHLSATHSLIGDREITLGFVEVFGNKNKIDSIEDDIIIIENNLLEISTSEQIKKRSRRQKLPKLSNTPEIVERKQQEQQQKPPIKLKFTRSSSNLSICSNDDLLPSTNTTSKRPIRNRVKPVHKDFVYDLSHILKKDVLSEVLPAKTQKRRNTLATNVDLNDQDELTLSSNKMIGIAPLAPPPPSSSLSQQQHQFELENKPIKGSAYKMAKIAVTTFRASFSQLSDNLPERISLPLRILPHMMKNDDLSTQNLDTVRGSHQDKTVSSDHMKYRRMSDDSITHILSKRKRLDPILTKKKNSSYSIHEKNNDNDDDYNRDEIYQNSSRKNDERIIVKCPTEKEFQEYLITNKLTEPVKKIPVTPFSDSKILGTTSSSPPTSKRITLMQRLTENKHKKLQQSLLRSVLEN